MYRVDRLSRSVRGLAQILEALDHAHVLFRSATEPFDTGTPAGRMMVQMLGAESRLARTTRGQEMWIQVAVDGTWFWSTRNSMYQPGGARVGVAGA